jgi:integrase
MSIERTAQGKRRVRWRDTDGQSRARVFETLNEARTFEAQVRVDKRRGADTIAKGSNMTVEEWAGQWLSTLGVRPATAHSYESIARLHIIPGLGDIKLSGLRRPTVQRFARNLDLAPASAKLVVTVLKVMLNEAVASDVIMRNPASGVTVPGQRRTGSPLLEPEQITALAAAIRPDLEVSIWLGAGAGLRIGEVFGLRVCDIDFLRREIHVTQQRDGLPLKTRASARTIPLDDMVVLKLSQHVRDWPGEYLVGAAYPTFTGLWRQAVKKAGLPAGTRFHDLRKWHGSVLVASGMSVKLVQERLGHASAVTTLSIYAGTWPADKNAGRGLVSAALEDVHSDVHDQRG